MPSRESLTSIQEQHCRIIGGTLLSWLKHHGPQFLKERFVLSKILRIDPEPFIIFTSDIPGLVAAQEVIGQGATQIGFMLEEEYASSALLRTTPEFRHHIHIWSFFRPVVEPVFETKARVKYPLPKGCVYWQHNEGTMWADHAGRGAEHLWRWDGHELELLEEAFSHWVA